MNTLQQLLEKATSRPWYQDGKYRITSKNSGKRIGHTIYDEFTQTAYEQAENDANLIVYLVNNAHKYAQLEAAANKVTNVADRFSADDGFLYDAIDELSAALAALQDTEQETN